MLVTKNVTRHAHNEGACIVICVDEEMDEGEDGGGDRVLELSFGLAVNFPKRTTRSRGI